MHIRLAERGLVFSTRIRGRLMREELLGQLSDTDIATIDFEDVLSASYSFIDEFIGKLAQAHSALELVNVPAKIEQTIEESLKRRRIDSRRLFMASLVCH